MTDDRPGLAGMPDDPKYLLESGWPMPDLTIVELAGNPQPDMRINGCLPLPPGTIIELTHPVTRANADVVVTSLRFRPDSRCIILYVNATEE